MQKDLSSLKEDNFETHNDILNHILQHLLRLTTINEPMKGSLHFQDSICKRDVSCEFYSIMYMKNNTNTRKER